MPKAKVEQVDMFDGVAPAPSPVVEEAQAIWNEHAAIYKWKKCQVLDKARQASIKRAVGDYGGIAGWRSSLSSVAKNRFVQGMIAPREGYKQFVANIDWFCRPVTVRKVLEDFYEDEGADKKKGGASNHLAPAETELEKWGRWLRSYKPGRFWPSSQGPRPEDPGCIAAPGPLAYWRKQHNITVAAAPRAESREDRLRATITTFRKFGRYDRANEIEQELADIEGRPAVLVPAPEVAHLTGSGPQRGPGGTQSPASGPPMSQKSPADEERSRREAFEKKRQSGTASDLPGWLDEAIPDSAYGDA